MTIPYLIIGLLLLILFIYIVSKHNEKVKQAIIEEADSFVASIIKERSLKPISTHLNLKYNETAFLQCNSILYETRNVRYYQSGHVGLRIAKGLYVGSSRGKSQSHEELKAIDSGTLILTNKRIVFYGSSNSRNIFVEKLITVNSFRDSISISSESRQKSIIFTVPNPLIWEFTIKLLSSVKDPLNLSNIEIESINVENSILLEKESDTKNIELNKSNTSVQDQSTSDPTSYNKKSNVNYISIVQAKYRMNRDNLKTRFKFAYDFLTIAENNDKDIWLSTSTNAHLYLRNNYLVYIVLNYDSISFRARYNQKIHSSTVDKSKEMFSNKFEDLILSLDGYKKGWFVQQNEFYTFMSSTPNEFFLSLFDYISKLKL